MSKKKRIFVGIPISSKLQAKLDKFLEDNFNGFSIRIVKPKNLHITIIPPWYSENLDKEREKLRKTESKSNPFELKFKKVSFGPTPTKPRLIWATGESNENIINLRDKLFEVYNKNLPKKIFVPHITMARYKGADYKKFPVKKFSKNVNWKEKIKNICLYQSLLKRSGAEYSVIEKVKF